jgi:hypothetical protein
MISTAAAMIVFAIVAPVAEGGAPNDCAAKVMQEWRIGRIKLDHPLACYRAALARLPEDLLAYSSASADIQSALHARLAALTAARLRAHKVQPHTRSRPPSPVAAPASKHGSKATPRTRRLGGASRSAASAPSASFASSETASNRRLPTPVIVLVAFLVGLAVSSLIARMTVRRSSK